MDKSINFAVVNNADPRGSVFAPEADFVFAVVHSKGSDGNQVICQGCTDMQTMASGLFTAIEGVHEAAKDHPLLLVLIAEMITAREKGDLTSSCKDVLREFDSVDDEGDQTEEEAGES